MLEQDLKTESEKANNSFPLMVWNCFGFTPLNLNDDPAARITAATTENLFLYD